LFFKSAAKRASTPAPATPAPAPVAAAPAAPLTVEALGQQLREAMPTRRLHSITVCDHEANVLWLSEGVLGPDEHGLVTEALAAFGDDTSLPSHETGLEDGRFALFLPVRSPNGNAVGVAMILADRKAVGDDTLERMMAPPVRAIMQRLAVLLRPGEARASSGTARVPALELDHDPTIAEALTPTEGLIPTVAAAPADSQVPGSEGITAEEIDDILEFDVTAEVSAAQAAASPSVAGSRSAEDDDAPIVDLDMLELDFATPAPKGPAARAPKAPAAAPVPATQPERPAPPVVMAAPAVKASPAPAPRVAPRPAPPPPPAAPARVAVASAPVVAAAAAVPVRAPAPAPLPPPVVPAPVAVAPAASAPAAPVGAAAAAAALVNDPNLLLELLPFAKLRPGGQTRRFQVLARGSGQQRDPAAVDALVLQRLLGWLAAHRAAWNSQPTSFTVSLSIATLEDERFAQKMAATLNTHGISPESIGYEIAEAVCTQRRAQVERFLTQCDKVGSWVVVDDFSFDSQVLPLLKSKAVRLVKIDAKLSSSALKDKLCQAMVVATVQAAKVLGIHCAAKKVDSQAALQWLTAIGCDFAQGQALAQAQPLDSLASSPDPTGISAMALPT
jgi:EAL domain-containing protein (putative c-di-GMP-specific phosphodiesterase class I)